MGTKVQSKSYMPGYYPMRDINEDASSSWPWYYTYKSLNGHLSNGFVPRPVVGYSEYDKEMLKRTMLEHEAIFRKQVYELHRLYQIQKDLMDEFQKKGFYKLSVPTDTSQSNSFSSPLPSDETKKTWQMSNLHAVSTSFDKSPVAGTDNMKPSLNFLKEGRGQSGSLVIKNRACQDSAPRRMFDLRLPADVFIHGEEPSKPVKENIAGPSFRTTSPLSKIRVADSDNDVKLSLNTGEGSTCRSDGWKSSSWTQNGHSSDKLADLNKPVKEACYEAAMDSVSTHFLFPRTCGEENQGPKMLPSSNTSFSGLQNAFVKDKHGDEGASSNFLHVDEETRRERLFLNNENGKIGTAVDVFSPGLCHDTFLMSSESIYQKFKKDHEIPLPEQNKTESWFRQKPIEGIEISRSGLHLDTSSNSGPTAASVPSLTSVFPLKDYPSISSSLVSSLSEPVNNISETSVAAQALQCIKGSTAVNISCSNAAIQQHGTDSENWQNNGDLRSCLRAGSNTSSYQNGFNHPFQLDSNAAPRLQLLSITSAKEDHNGSAFGRLVGQGSYRCASGSTCKDVISCRDLNLNQALSNEVQDGNTTEQDKAVNDSERKCMGSSGEIPWLRKRRAHNESVDAKTYPSQMEFGFSHDQCQLTSSSNAVASEFEEGNETGFCLSNLLRFTSALQAKGKRMQRNEVSNDTSSRRIFGFPFLDKIQQNATFSSSISHERQYLTSDTKCNEEDSLCQTDLACGAKVPSLEKQILLGTAVTKRVTGNISASFRNPIGQNAELNYIDNPKSSDVTAIKEVAVVSPPSVPSASPKLTSAIDLEMPATQSEVMISQQETLLSSKLNGLEKAECCHDALIRVAAENIVAMSVDTNRHGEEIKCQQLSPAKFDTLHWFAEVVLSNCENCRVLRGSGDCGSESSDVDGLDLFEAMTLKLEETKVDEYCYTLKEQQNKKEEDIGAASLLFTRPRRGQARRRQQRRDFQKDILPGLASLSRHEVTEDLQTIGGLMKASGKSWQTGFTKRTTSRNGLHSQAKVMRQSKSLAVTMEEIKISPPPMQPINTESEVDGRSVIGWGRTTRRCRRQRCPQGNFSAPLT